MGLHRSKRVKNTHPKAPALTKGAQRGVSENKNPVQRSAGGQIKYTFFQTLLLFINNNRCSSWVWGFFPQNTQQCLFGEGLKDGISQAERDCGTCVGAEQVSYPQRGLIQVTFLQRGQEN